MKFEKINENKIKCILNRHDLESRNINIREIASGSDNAHKFLAEVMAEAGNAVGFFVNGAPLMIEASPMPGGDIAVIITKVNGNNDELASTMNINFTAEAEPLIDENNEVSEEDELRNALGNFFEFAKNQIMKGSSAQGSKVPVGAGMQGQSFRPTPPPDGAHRANPERPKVTIPPVVVKTFVFYTKEIADTAFEALKRIYEGPCEIYRNAKTGSYYLVLHKGIYPIEVFNKVCNILIEYGAQVRVECSSEYYYREHYELVFEGDAKDL